MKFMRQRDEESAPFECQQLSVTCQFPKCDCDREAACDCCERTVPRHQVSRCWVTGIETFACDECRGVNDL